MEKFVVESSGNGEFLWKHNNNGVCFLLLQSNRIGRDCCCWKTRVHVFFHSSREMFFLVVGVNHLRLFLASKNIFIERQLFQRDHLRRRELAPRDVQPRRHGNAVPWRRSGAAARSARMRATAESASGAEALRSPASVSVSARSASSRARVSACPGSSTSTRAYASCGTRRSTRPSW